jgi:hypothetical protein
LPYDFIEGWLLVFLNHDLMATLLRDEKGGQEEEIARVTAKLVDLDRRIQVFQRAVEENPDCEEVAKALLSLGKRKKAASAELEKLRQGQAHSDAEALGEARYVHALLKQCPPNEVVDLRTRLKARIRSLVESAWILPQGNRRRKSATIQLFFRNGKWIRFPIEYPCRGGGPIALWGLTSALTPQDDLRQWRHLPDKPAFPEFHGKGATFTWYGLVRLEDSLRTLREQEPCGSDLVNPAIVFTAKITVTRGAAVEPR